MSETTRRGRRYEFADPSVLHHFAITLDDVTTDGRPETRLRIEIPAAATLNKSDRFALSNCVRQTLINTPFGQLTFGPEHHTEPPHPGPSGTLSKSRIWPEMYRDAIWTATASEPFDRHARDDDPSSHWVRDIARSILRMTDNWDRNSATPRRPIKREQDARASSGHWHTTVDLPALSDTAPDTLSLDLDPADRVIDAIPQAAPSIPGVGHVIVHFAVDESPTPAAIGVRARFIELHTTASGPAALNAIVDHARSHWPSGPSSVRSLVEWHAPTGTIEEANLVLMMRGFDAAADNAEANAKAARDRAIELVTTAAARFAG